MPLKFHIFLFHKFVTCDFFFKYTPISVYLLYINVYFYLFIFSFTGMANVTAQYRIIWLWHRGKNWKISAWEINNAQTFGATVTQCHTYCPILFIHNIVSEKWRHFINHFVYCVKFVIYLYFDAILYKKRKKSV